MAQSDEAVREDGALPQHSTPLHPIPLLAPFMVAPHRPLPFPSLPMSGVNAGHFTSAAASLGTAAVLGVIDLGTNNCRMLIARPDGDNFRVIDSFSRITRLGEGLASSGRLCQAAEDRTIEALKRCADKMYRRQVNTSRLVATEACRRASNGADFLRRVAQETGLTLECIPALEEARLALTGCARLLSPQRPWALIFDIGGGSTELLWVRQGEAVMPTVEAFATLPLGVVTVAEDCGGGDMGQRTYDQVVRHVKTLLQPFDQQAGIREHIADGSAQMLGTSGTVTTLAGLHLGLARYDRTVVDGVVMTFEALAGVSHKLAAMSHRQRIEQPCIGVQRADLVLAGCAILEAICQMWPMGNLTVADRGLREGMLMDLMEATQAAASPSKRPRSQAVA